MEIFGKTFSIGADPEVFVSNNGAFMSGHSLIRGTKYEPMPVNKGAVQVDGMALEFNIDPAFSEEEFISNITEVQSQLKEMISPFDFMSETSVTFSREFLDDIPPENVMLGCDPDFNAYTMSVTPKPSAGKLMRTVGGHIHIGGFFTDSPYSREQIILSSRLAKLMDESVGIYSLLWDNDSQRRKMYGKAGSFRPKPYGMEYRSLSNKWIWNKEIIRFVFEGTKEAITNFFNDNYQPNEEVELIINKNLNDHPLLKTEKANFVRSLVC